jgi:hypothetical protein
LPNKKVKQPRIVLERASAFLEVSVYFSFQSDTSLFSVEGGKILQDRGVKGTADGKPYIVF